MRVGLTGPCLVKGEGEGRGGLASPDMVRPTLAQTMATSLAFGKNNREIKGREKNKERNKNQNII